MPTRLLRPTLMPRKSSAYRIAYLPSTGYGAAVAGCIRRCVSGMAGKIQDEDIALVRERTSIVDVISEQVTLKPAGSGNLKGLCPFHDEKTPSFTVSAARNVYYCHGCEAGGDALRFVLENERLRFVA